MYTPPERSAATAWGRVRRVDATGPNTVPDLLNMPAATKETEESAAMKRTSQPFPKAAPEAHSSATNTELLRAKFTATAWGRASAMLAAPGP
jgi:hypothetical protein